MSKKILHTLFALAAALILTGGFSMTAYAGGGEEYEATETPAPEPEETINPSDPLGRKQAAYHSNHQERELFLYPY